VAGLKDNMDLKQALDRAGKFTAKRSADAAHQAVIVKDGKISATNGISGILIPFPALKGMSFAVDCAHFRAQVSAIGADPKIAVKGKRVEIRGKRGKFTIAQLPEQRWPKRPAIPKKGFVEVSAETVSALDLLCAFPDSDSQGNFQTQGIRLTEHWCAAGSSTHGAILWAAGLISTAPVTVSPAVFVDLSGAIEMAVTSKHLWVINEDGETRWTTPFTGDWPDAFASLVANHRARAADAEHPVARESFTIAPETLGEVATIASVESENDLASMRMTVTDKLFAITGGPQEATSDVATQVDIKGTATSHEIGISPRHLSKVADVMGRLPGGGSRCFVTVGDPLEPVIVKGDGAPVMEALVMPLRL